MWKVYLFFSPKDVFNEKITENGFSPNNVLPDTLGINAAAVGWR